MFRRLFKITILKIIILYLCQIFCYLEFRRYKNPHLSILFFKGLDFLSLKIMVKSNHDLFHGFAKITLIFHWEYSFLISIVHPITIVFNPMYHLSKSVQLFPFFLQCDLQHFLHFRELFHQWKLLIIHIAHS